MKLRFSVRILVLALAVAAGFGVISQPGGTPVASADGFGRTQVTFTKWVTEFPAMAGVVGGDVGDGDFVGTIRDAVPLAGGKIVKISAEYHLNGSLHQSTLSLTVWQFDNKFAVINGSVVDGWKKGALAYGTYKVISCDEAPDGTCFPGHALFRGWPFLVTADNECRTGVGFGPRPVTCSSAG